MFNSSPLLALPREIRNRIYRHLLYETFLRERQRPHHLCNNNNYRSKQLYFDVSRSYTQKNRIVTTLFSRDPFFSILTSCRSMMFEVVEEFDLWLTKSFMSPTYVDGRWPDASWRDGEAQILHACNIFGQCVSEFHRNVLLLELMLRHFMPQVGVVVVEAGHDANASSIGRIQEHVVRNSGGDAMQLVKCSSDTPVEVRIYKDEHRPINYEVVRLFGRVDTFLRRELKSYEPVLSVARGHIGCRCGPGMLDDHAQ